MKLLHALTASIFLLQLLLISPLAGQCPTRVGFNVASPCGGDVPGFYFFFAPALNVPPTFEVQFSNPCAPASATANLLSCSGGTWSSPAGTCTQVPTGWFTFNFPNGTSSQCYISQGLPQTCGKFTGSCREALIKFAKDFIQTPAADCKQWEGPCTTDGEIFRNGVVAIGTNNTFGEYIGSKLVVKGGITSERLQICKTEWCDYVFSDTFRLMPLSEVKQYVQTNRHLPGVTPGPVIEREGSFSLADQTVQQQEKIEVSYLHLIALRKRLDALGNRTARLGLITAPDFLPHTDVKTEIVPVPLLPTFAVICSQIAPATTNTAADGTGGVWVYNLTAPPLTITWTGPVSGSKSNVTCTNGVIKLPNLKAGSYTVTIKQSDGSSETRTLLILVASHVSCDELKDEPCKTEILNVVKGAAVHTPKCIQWKGDPCSTTGHLYRTGTVGIGSSSIPSGYSLAVKGGILTDHFFIELCGSNGATSWCDYVFDPGYQLPNLYQVDQFIQQNKRLPGSISQAEVMKDGGIELGSIKLDQQKKIEESYLYLIEMNKKVNALKAQIESFE